LPIALLTLPENKNDSIFKLPLAGAVPATFACRIKLVSWDYHPSVENKEIFETTKHFPSYPVVSPC
jgi:hypothetical protein